MPADVRSVIEDESAKVDMINNQNAVRDDELAYDVWRKNGGEVAELSAAERADLRRKTETVGEIATANDPGAREMFNLMLQAAARTRGKS